MARMRADERRRQLLEAATRIFSRLGYSGTTTASLAEEAGVSEPVLYQHFKSKLHLFTSLIEAVGAEVLAAWRKALEGVSDPTDRMTILLAGNPATHERGRGIYRVIFQAMSDVDCSPQIRRAIRRHVTELHVFLTEELTHLQAKRTVRRDERAPTMAWFLITVAIGYGMLTPTGLARDLAEREKVQAMVAEVVGKKSRKA